MIFMPLAFTVETYDRKKRLVEVLLIKKPFVSKRKVARKYKWS